MWGIRMCNPPTAFFILDTQNIYKSVITIKRNSAHNLDKKKYLKEIRWVHDKRHIWYGNSLRLFFNNNNNKDLAYSQRKLDTLVYSAGLAWLTKLERF